MNTEIDALKAVDVALSGLQDPAARERVLSWACKKFASTQLLASVDGSSSHADGAKRAKKSTTAGSTKPKGKAKNRVALSIAKDLDLKPKGKESLDDFASKKKPKSNFEKCAVAVYYLKHELGLAAVSASHVFTCFKRMKWRLPSNLSNILRETASRYGWLDTSSSDNINTSTIGENLVEHDLPRRETPKKK